MGAELSIVIQTCVSAPDSMVENHQRVIDEYRKSSRRRRSNSAGGAVAAGCGCVAAAYTFVDDPMNYIELRLMSSAEARAFVGPAGSVSSHSSRAVSLDRSGAGGNRVLMLEPSCDTNSMGGLAGGGDATAGALRAKGYAALAQALKDPLIAGRVGLAVDASVQLGDYIPQQSGRYEQCISRILANIALAAEPGGAEPGGVGSRVWRATVPRASFYVLDMSESKLNDESATWIVGDVMTRVRRVMSHRTGKTRQRSQEPRQHTLFQSTTVTTTTTGGNNKARRRGSIMNSDDDVGSDSDNNCTTGGAVVVTRGRAASGVSVQVPVFTKDTRGDLFCSSLQHVLFAHNNIEIGGLLKVVNGLLDFLPAPKGYDGKGEQWQLLPRLCLVDLQRQDVLPSEIRQFMVKYVPPTKQVVILVSGRPQSEWQSTRDEAAKAARGGDGGGSGTPSHRGPRGRSSTPTGRRTLSLNREKPDKPEDFEEVYIIQDQAPADNVAAGPLPGGSDDNNTTSANRSRSNGGQQQQQQAEKLEDGDNEEEDEEEGSEASDASSIAFRVEEEAAPPPFAPTPTNSTDHHHHQENTVNSNTSRHNRDDSAARQARAASHTYLDNQPRRNSTNTSTNNESGSGTPRRRSLEEQHARELRLLKERQLAEAQREEEARRREQQQRQQANSNSYNNQQQQQQQQQQARERSDLARQIAAEQERLNQEKARLAALQRQRAATGHAADSEEARRLAAIRNDRTARLAFLQSQRDDIQRQQREMYDEQQREALDEQLARRDRRQQLPQDQQVVIPRERPAGTVDDSAREERTLQDRLHRILLEEQKFYREDEEEEDDDDEQQLLDNPDNKNGNTTDDKDSSSRSSHQPRPRLTFDPYASSRSRSRQSPTTAAAIAPAPKPAAKRRAATPKKPEQQQQEPDANRRQSVHCQTENDAAAAASEDSRTDRQRPTTAEEARFSNVGGGGRDQHTSTPRSSRESGTQHAPAAATSAPRSISTAATNTEPEAASNPKKMKTATTNTAKPKAKASAKPATKSEGTEAVPVVATSATQTPSPPSTATATTDSPRAVRKTAPSRSRSPANTRGVVQNRSGSSSPRNSADKPADGNDKKDDDDDTLNDNEDNDDDDVNKLTTISAECAEDEVDLDGEPAAAAVPAEEELPRERTPRDIHPHHVDPEEEGQDDFVSSASSVDMNDNDMVDPAGEEEQHQEDDDEEEPQPLPEEEEVSYDQPAVESSGAGRASMLSLSSVSRDYSAAPQEEGDHVQQQQQQKGPITADTRRRPSAAAVPYKEEEEEDDDGGRNDRLEESSRARTVSEPPPPFHDPAMHSLRPTGPIYGRPAPSLLAHQRNDGGQQYTGCPENGMSPRSTLHSRSQMPTGETPLSAYAATGGGDHNHNEDEDGCYNTDDTNANRYSLFNGLDPEEARRRDEAAARYRDRRFDGVAPRISTRWPGGADRPASPSRAAADNNSNGGALAVEKPKLRTNSPHPGARSARRRSITPRSRRDSYPDNNHQQQQQLQHTAATPTRPSPSDIAVSPSTAGGSVTPRGRSSQIRRGSIADGGAPGETAASRARRASSARRRSELEARDRPVYHQPRINRSSASPRIDSSTPTSRNNNRLTGSQASTADTNMTGGGRDGSPTPVPVMVNANDMMSSGGTVATVPGNGNVHKSTNNGAYDESTESSNSAQPPASSSAWPFPLVNSKLRTQRPTRMS